MHPGNIPDKDIPAAEPADVIRQYEGWINKIVKRYSGLLNDTGAIDTEDMTQAGKTALLEAIKSFDPSKGKSFTGWSFFPIRNEILKLFGYDNPGRKRPPLPLISLDEPIDENADEPRLNNIEDPNCIIPEDKAVQDAEREEIREEVRAAVDRMKNENYRTVVKRVWLDGQDKKTLASEMGISVETVQHFDRDGRSKLSHDYKLRRLAYPRFNIGLTRYRTTLTSAVEAAVLWREQYYDEHYGEGSFIAAGGHDPENV